MIKVGEYIRSVDGFIRKVTRVNEKGTYEGLCYGAYSLDVSYKNSIGISSKKVKSHSKNIIDLIEVNDIVTYWVDTQSYNGWVQNFVDEELLKDMKENFIEEDIKSIVTHEQIENMEYRV